MLLKKRKHERILYDAILDAIGKQIPSRWERRMFKSVVRNTHIRAADELGGGRGWELKGQNVSHVVVGPRGKKYIGPVEIYIPKETLGKLKGLGSRDAVARRAAEEALHTISHEFAHDYFGAIDYEARMTRYLRDNPGIVKRALADFLKSGGRLHGRVAEEKAEMLVRESPLFWSNYVAHTAHEAGADMMAAEAVERMVHGGHATRRDIYRQTTFRPFTVREFIKLRLGGRLRDMEPKKPSRLEELAKGIDYTAMRFMEHMGRAYRTTHIRESITPGRIKERRFRPV